LELNVIVAQGTAKWLKASDFSENNDISEEISVNGNSCLLLNFVHPSGGPKGWGNSPENPYLREKIVSTIRSAVKRLLN
jgi:hypothetical protein